MIFVFKQCYEYGYWDQVITLWNPIEKLLSQNNEIKKLRTLTSTIDTSPKINFLQKLFTIYMIFLLIYWFVLNLNGFKTGFWNDFYSLCFTVFPITGGIVGIFRSKAWGFLKSNIGKALFFISLGLFSWGLGNVIWGYYNFILNTESPYPSLADAGFMPAYFFWVVGIVYLSKATGTKFTVSQAKNRLPLLVIPFGIIFLSSYFLFSIKNRTFSSESIIRIIFDFYYPWMDIVIISIAIIIFGLSINFFGGKYRLSIFAILLGFTFQYVGDFIFSYMNSIGTFYNGGPADLMFSLALALISWGTLSFYLTPKRKSSST
jgi:hypothetical protein